MTDTHPDSCKVWTPVTVMGENLASRWLIVCDHATNTVPEAVAGGDLGISADDMGRHIAYDIGAAEVTRQLAEHLDAPAVLSDFSRLVIDPNRGEDDPTLVMQLYDGTIIPGNRGITQEGIAQRLDLCYRPYHDAVARLAARRSDTVIVSVHSYTPQLRGRAPRPWHAGLLFAHDARLSLPMVQMLRDDGFCVGENQPYTGALAGDTIDRHALAHGRQNTLVEVRNDLIADAEGQNSWAERLAGLLPRALAQAEGT